MKNVKVFVFTPKIANIFPVAPPSDPRKEKEYKSPRFTPKIEGKNSVGSAPGPPKNRMKNVKVLVFTSKIAKNVPGVLPQTPRKENEERKSVRFYTQNRKKFPGGSAPGPPDTLFFG